MDTYYHIFVRSDGVTGSTKFEGWSAETCADKCHHEQCKDERTLFSTVLIPDRNEIRSRYARDKTYREVTSN